MRERTARRDRERPLRIARHVAVALDRQTELLAQVIKPRQYREPDEDDPLGDARKLIAQASALLAEYVATRR